MSQHQTPMKDSVHITGSVHGSQYEPDTAGYTIPPAEGSHTILLNSLKTNYNRAYMDKRKNFLEQKFAMSPVHKHETYRKKKAVTFSGLML